MENIALEKANKDLEEAKKDLIQRQNKLIVFEASVSALEMEKNNLKSCIFNMDAEIGEIVQNSKFLDKEREIIQRDLEQFRNMAEEIYATKMTVKL